MVAACGGVVVDEAAVQPNALAEQGGGTLLLARPAGDGTWQRTDLRKFLPAEWSAWRLKAPGGATFTRGGTLVVVGQVQRPGDDEPSWGHPTNEVVRFASRDGGKTFSFAVVSRPDAAESHWLPNLERSTGHNDVPERPGVIYTAGGPGEKNTELLSNRVLFSQIDA